MSLFRKLWNDHPNLISWLLLAVGMVIIVVIAARNVGFQAGQWAALIAATVALAGLCVWIISWEDREPEEREPDQQ
jgi:CHASE2 domain-containing sensor protein